MRKLLQDHSDKRDNFFDRVDIILTTIKKIRGRLNNPDHEEEAKIYRKALHKLFDQKVKEKRLGGMRLQSKCMPILMVIAVALLIWGLLAKHGWTIFFALIALAYFIWSYGSAVSRLYVLVREADREAMAAVRATRPPEQNQPTQGIRQSTRRRQISREDLMRRAAQNR